MLIQSQLISPNKRQTFKTIFIRLHHLAISKADYMATILRSASMRRYWSLYGPILITPEVSRLYTQSL